MAFIYDRTKDRHTQKVEVISPTTLFGELSIAPNIPHVQVEALYGLRTVNDVETYTDGSSGSVGVDDSGYSRQFKVSTGTSVGGYGVIRTQSPLRYRPGQINRFQFTGVFTSPVSNSRQAVGALGVGNELTFGYNGVDFGIMYRRGGRLETRRATITVGAGGSETLTITLNNTPYVVAVTAASATSVAQQISTVGNFGNGWVFWQNGTTITFMAQSTGAKSGTYSLTSTGTTTATFSQVRAGTDPIDEFIKQADWNINKCLDTGGRELEQAFNLNPLKGNVFQIEQAYLGYGSIMFSIMHPTTNRFINVHCINYANSNLNPSVDNPILKIGVFAYSLGSTNNLIVKSASMAGFTQGTISEIRRPRGQPASKSSIGTSITPILSVRCRREFGTHFNLLELVPLSVSFSTEGTKPAEYYILINGLLTGANWTYENQNDSIAEIDTTATSVSITGDSYYLFAGGLPKSGSVNLNLVDYGIILSPGSTITLGVRATSSTTDASVGIVWAED